MPPKNKNATKNPHLQTSNEDSSVAIVKTLTEIVNKLIYSYEKNEKINLTRVILYKYYKNMEKIA